MIAAIDEGDAMAGEFWFEREFFVELMLPVYELLPMGDGTTRQVQVFQRLPQAARPMGRNLQATGCRV